MKYNTDITHKIRVTAYRNLLDYTENNTKTNNYMEYWYYDRHITTFF